MAILNPDCADCGHDLQHHYAGAGTTGCKYGDCQCALFVSKNKKTEEKVDEALTQLVQDTSDGAIPEEEARAFLGLKDDKARTSQEVIDKLASGEWSTERASAEMRDLEKAAGIFYDAADPATSMQTEEFTRLIEEQIKRSTSLLIDKAKEYASDTDRLHNFKVAAGILGETQEQALGGFLVKHIVSVFDMINSGKEYPIEVWNEKITDSINYLLILRAMQR